MYPLYALDTWGRNYGLIFKKYNKEKLEFPKKELVWVKQDFSEFKNSYFNMSNYNRADEFMAKNKVLYNYENIWNNEWIHRSATYFNDNGVFSYNEYLDLLEHFYKKLDNLL